MKSASFREDDEKVLLEILGDESYYQGLRREAILTLERVRPLSSRGLAALRRAGNDGDWLVFTSATECLIRLGLDSSETLDKIRETLSHSSFGMRRWAAETLGKLGPRARDAIPALIATTDDRDEDVRSAAVEALRTIRNE